MPRSRALFEECLTRYRSGDDKCALSNVIFNSLAQTIATDPIVEDKETSILALFEQMESTGCNPNLISFNIL